MSRETSYLGNQLLKGTNVRQEWSKDQINEYVKCSKNPIYFIEKYVKIIQVDKGLVPFNMYPFQKKLVKHVHNNRFSLVKMSRQSGKSSTIVAGYLLWYILFNESKTVGILANKGQTARELLGRLQLAYQHLPKFIQQGVTEFNKGSFALENGSRVLAAATSSTAVRGYSFSLIYLDEFAFIPPNVFEEFYLSVYPTISSGKETKVIAVSTPKGMNHFYKMWVDAEKGRSAYKTFEAFWTDVPGRDEDWKDQEIANLGSFERFDQEHNCVFKGSANTLISSAKLNNMPFIDPISSKDKLDIFDYPVVGRRYVIIADTAMGIGLDYNSFAIIDVTAMPYKLVAKFRDNRISELVFPSVIYRCAKDYNMADVLVEVNKNMTVATTLHYDLEYENVLFVTPGGRRGQTLGSFSKDAVPGIQTSKKTKRIGCSNLKDLIEQDKLIVTDFDTISELTQFVNVGSSYEAEEGAHDDLVMPLVIFGWMVDQPYFRELTDSELRKAIYNDKIKKIEEDTYDFFMDDGINDHQNMDKMPNGYTIYDK